MAETSVLDDPGWARHMAPRHDANDVKGKRYDFAKTISRHPAAFSNVGDFCGSAVAFLQRGLRKFGDEAAPGDMGGLIQKTGASRCRSHEVNMFEKSPIDQTVTGALLNFDHYHMDNQMFLFRNLPDGRVR